MGGWICASRQATGGDDRRRSLRRVSRQIVQLPAFAGHERAVRRRRRHSTPSGAERWDDRSSMSSKGREVIRPAEVGDDRQYIYDCAAETAVEYGATARTYGTTAGGHDREAPAAHYEPVEDLRCCHLASP